jgi:hypothetical protein
VALTSGPMDMDTGPAAAFRIWPRCMSGVAAGPVAVMARQTAPATTRPMQSRQLGRSPRVSSSHELGSCSTTAP